METRLSRLMARHFYALHADVKRMRHAEYWLAGGRGSGKSSFVSLEIILGLIRHADANAIVLRKVGATLRESVYEQMLWAVNMLNVQPQFQARLTPMELIYLPTGQRILFRGIDDPAKLKSLKLERGYFKYLWFEELTEFAGIEEMLNVKASVIRGEKRACTFASYNPPVSVNNWVNAEALLPNPDRLVVKSTYLEMPPEWLGADFLAQAEALKLNNERLYRNMYLGEATGGGGRVFENLALRRIAKAELADRAYCGLDFGFARDPDAFVKLDFDYARGKLRVVDEYYATSTSIDALAREVKKRANGICVWCDSAEPRMIAELRARGVNALAVKKGAGSVEHGMRFLTGLSEIAIDPDVCPNAAREFAGYELKSDSRGGFMAEYPDCDNHAIDATRYALERVSEKRRAGTFDRAKLGI